MNSNQKGRIQSFHFKAKTPKMNTSSSSVLSASQHKGILKNSDQIQSPKKCVMIDDKVRDIATGKCVPSSAASVTGSSYRGSFLDRAQRSSEGTTLLLDRNMDKMSSTMKKS